MAVYFASLALGSSAVARDSRRVACILASPFDSYNMAGPALVGTDVIISGLNRVIIPPPLRSTESLTCVIHWKCRYTQ